jgi:DNA polymerase III epsilon subunit family exonuclease
VGRPWKALLVHDELIHTVPLAVVDVETTGLWAETGDRVCEIAVGRVEAGAGIEIHDWLVNPGRPIHPEAAAVNGIRDADVAGAEPFARLIPQLEPLFDGAVLVAHNAAFDLGFLAVEYRIAGVQPPQMPVLDTLALARGNFSFASNGLGALAAQLGVPVDREHRAAGDVATTYGVLCAMARRLARTGSGTLDDLLRLQGNMPTIDLPRPRGLSDPLAHAIDHGVAVLIAYRDARGNVTERLVEPLFANGQYLIAHCHLQHGQRTFRLDRIIDARLP